MSHISDAVAQSSAGLGYRQFYRDDRRYDYTQARLVLWDGRSHKALLVWADTNARCDGQVRHDHIAGLHDWEPFEWKKRYLLKREALH